MASLQVRARWWSVTHPPRSFSWVPPWRRHKARCSESLTERLRDGGNVPIGYVYCADCDYWHLTRWNPVFWLVTAFGEV